MNETHLYNPTKYVYSLVVWEFGVFSTYNDLLTVYENLQCVIETIQQKIVPLQLHLEDIYKIYECVQMLV